ncbi:MAG: XRE family transcriptional regulator [Betaproteobacteria bacterium]|jgi:hypothetical protein|nr:XRE family transcriptional regulator [Betaproteobacteria bacterium]NBX88808.1 XRE family transcriptional regulator [Betaproteobacteria bacterium]
MKPNTWTAKHGERLKALREASQIDITTLARHHTLSVSQIRQLEEGGNSTFYSEEIKLNAGRKLFHAMGGEMPDALEVGLGVGDAVQQSLGDSPIAPRKQSATIIIDNVLLVKNKKYILAMGLALSGTWLVGDYLLGLVITRSNTAPAAISPGQTNGSLGNHLSSDAMTRQAEPVAKMLEPATSVAEAKSTGSTENCQWRVPEKILISPQPIKPGNYVHVVALSEIKVCVVDANDQKTILDLKPGVAKSVYGHPPFKVYSTHYKNVKLFYQGHQIRIPEDADTYLSLNEQKWIQQ